MDVADKDAQGLAVWLGEQGIPGSICGIFEGDVTCILIHNMSLLCNWRYKVILLISPLTSFVSTRAFKILEFRTYPKFDLTSFFA